MAWAGVVGTLGARQRRWLVMLTVVATLFVPASAQPRIGFLWDEREYAPILAQEICYDEGLSATYVIGKAYEMIAGPLPARIMDKTLPFIQEAQDRGTLWGQRTVDKGELTQREVAFVLADHSVFRKHSTGFLAISIV
eukprot:3524982-Rhodomonas_salina.1